MKASSRTPEGVPYRCPVCGKRVVIERSDPPGDACCPHCGRLLWPCDTEGDETIIVRWPEGRTLFLEDENDLANLVATSQGEGALAERASSDLVLDFSRVAFLSSGALGKLVTLDRKTRAAGGSLKLRNVRPELLDVFHVTKLDRLFQIEPS